MKGGLTLEFQDESVAIDIENDSQGFDVEATLARRQDGAPFGLMGMRERVDTLNGTLVVESQLGEGTSVRARVLMQSSLTPKGGEDKWKRYGCCS